MLPIRPEQMQAFADADAARFQKSAVSHLREHYPKHCKDKSDTDLREYITRCTSAASKYGLNSEAAVIVWAELVIRYGERFDWGVQTPSGKATWGRYILKHDELNEPDKVERLAGYIVREADIPENADSGREEA